jgi:hypothetical protein
MIVYNIKQIAELKWINWRTAKKRYVDLEKVYRINKRWAEIFVWYILK